MTDDLTEMLRRRVSRRDRADTTAAPSYAEAATLTEAFALVAERHPDRPAVRCGETTLTYAQLDARADVLAAAIQAEVDEPERPVAILLDRSADMVAAALAVLRTGSSYIPLDPATPAARLELILDDADPGVVLTTGRLAERVADAPKVDVAEITDARGAVRPVPVAPDDRAYIIFTSGTTGRPKGVQIPHINVLRLLTGAARHFDFDEYDVWTLFHTFAFDVSVWEMWGALLHGSCLVVLTEDEVKDPTALWDVLDRQRVSVLCQTPTAFQQLIEHDSGRDKRLALRHVIMAGEALHFSGLRRWVDRYGDEQPRLINMYGPTETTVYVSYRRVRRADLTERRSLIGAPLAGVGFTVVDDQLAPVADGEPGELVITGVTLSSGYLGSPRLNRARFVRLPGTGQRAYRTGDVVVRVADGDFEYRGRQDDQIKIRGYRVELGEVESALRALDGIDGAAVVARDLPVRGTTLVAYVVTGPTMPDAAVLHQRLAAVMPGYMIPGIFVPIDRLPMTANGKLDRRALPEPATAQVAPAEITPARMSVTQPQDVTEEQIQKLVADLLGTDGIDPATSFFEMGGHSLLAVRLIARVNGEFGVDVPLRAFLREPTVRALAALVRDTSPEARPGSGGVPLLRAPHDQPVSATDPQRRLYFLAQVETDSAAYHMHQTSILRGELDVEALQSAFRRIVDRHTPLRTVLRLDAEGLCQVVQSPGRFRMDVQESDLPAGADEKAYASRLSDEELNRSFDLERDDMLRVRLVRVRPDLHVLLVTMHHMAADGWSVGVLIRELIALYRYFRSAERTDVDPLAPLPLTYDDYSYSMVRWASGDTAERDLDYWEQRLRGLPAVHSLRLDRPRPERLEPAGATVRRTLPEQTLQALRVFSARTGTTPFMVMHAAFAVLLVQRSATDDVVVGTPVANRPAMELENLIGMFVNTLVRRTRVSSDVSFDDLLAQVREDTMLDLEHQHVPLDMVVQRLNPPRSPAYQPLYQIMFAYQHVPPNLIDLDGVDVELTVAPEQDAQAELMLDVFDWDSRLELRWNYHPQLFGRTTIEALADDFERVLRRALTAPATPVGQMAATSQGLLRLRRHPGSAVPVFALPGILGLGASFAQLSAFVDDRTLYALPVRDLHRRGIDPGARELAASCADLIAEVTDADGVHLAGHSFGGTLNLYVARALQERGIPVRSIVLLDSNVPDVVRRRLSGTRRERLVRFLSILADTLPGLRRRAPDDLAVRLRDTPEDEILIQTRALITQEERDLLGDDLHAVFAAYVAMSALDWPAFTPPEDVPVLLIEAASGRMPDEDPAGDWSRLLGDRLRLDAVDADHESMLRHPHVRDVAAKMGRFLAEHEGRP